MSSLPAERDQTEVETAELLMSWYYLRWQADPTVKCAATWAFRVKDAKLA